MQRKTSKPSAPVVQPTSDPLVIQPVSRPRPGNLAKGKPLKGF